MDPGKHNETATLTYMGTCTQHKSYQIQKSRTTQGKTRLKMPLHVLDRDPKIMGMSQFCGYVRVTYVGMSRYCGYITLSWICHTFMDMSHFCG